MKPEPISWQYLSVSGTTAPEWVTVPASRAVALKERGFQVRGVHPHTETERERGLTQLVDHFTERTKCDRTRLLTAMGFIRNGEAEMAMSILRSLTAT